jgi:hypothetical protein
MNNDFYFHLGEDGVIDQFTSQKEFDAFIKDNANDYNRYLDVTKSKTNSQGVTGNVTVEDTLKERGGRYGSFDTHAVFAEEFNRVYEGSDNWDIMRSDSKEALRIIANKIGRILNGDPEYDDNWRDIAGYATLVLQRIERENLDDKSAK